MFSLFHDEHIRIRAETLAQLLKFSFAPDLAGRKHPHFLHDGAFGDELIGEADLLVDLERACLHADCL